MCTLCNVRFSPVACTYTCHCSRDLNEEPLSNRSPATRHCVPTAYKPPILCLQVRTAGAVQCQICHMMFGDQSAISAHYDAAHGNTATTRARPGVGTHECDVCGKKFSERSNLKRHLSTVHGFGDVKTFQCDVCSRNFSQKAALTRHLKNVHRTQ